MLHQLLSMGTEDSLGLLLLLGMAKLLRPLFKSFIFTTTKQFSKKVALNLSYCVWDTDSTTRTSSTGAGLWKLISQGYEDLSSLVSLNFRDGLFICIRFWSMLGWEMFLLLMTFHCPHHIPNLHNLLIKISQGSYYCCVSMFKLLIDLGFPFSRFSLILDFLF